MKITTNNRYLIQKMKKYFGLYIVVGTLLCLFSNGVWAKAYRAEDYYHPVQTNDQFEKTAETVTTRLFLYHYQRLVPNDTLSSQVFDKYFDDLDPRKLFFLRSDVDEFSIYRDKIDNMMSQGRLAPLFAIYNRYQKRLTERYVYLLNTIESKIGKLDFSEDEYLAIDRDDDDWAASDEVLDKIWIQRLKNSVLSMKLDGDSIEKIKETLSKRYESQLKRIAQSTDEDAFTVICNAYAGIHDPHTRYMSPREYENFNIHMNLSLEGIGTVLQQKDDYTKIVRVVPGGPADKSRQIKAGDRIVGVAQGEDGEFENIIGWRLEKVVPKIRGNKGTVVRLEIIPAGAPDTQAPKEVSIVRNKIELEYKEAKKEIIEIPRKNKSFRMGVIRIPNFYIDLSDDVRRILDELKKEKVDGIVLDLRDNSGGSLEEAIKVSGLFINEGPVLQVRQVRNGNDRTDVYSDPDPNIVYDGPLLVMVNRLSASASEILAGAMQDYRRALVVGDDTFGKGTVQNLSPIDFGSIKMTYMKFYRVSGQSTQNRGVVPDLRFPSMYDHEEIGESSLDHALPWDSIRSADYFAYPAITDKEMASLISKHEQRVRDNPDIIFLKDTIARLEQQRQDKRVSLNEKKRVEERNENEAWQLAAENRRRKAKGLEPLKELEPDDDDEDAVFDEDARDDEPDALLEEGAQILADQIEMGLLKVRVVSR